MATKTGIEKAVGKFDGSPTKLAEAVGKGVLRQHVEHWLKSGRVSSERCPEVSAVSGVPCDELNSKIDWKLAADLALAERAA